MSGIEIAGLLLGSFPLLISALENYRETAEVLEDWWQIKKEYKKCKNEIKVQELAFESNLERFLLPLVVDDDEISSLIAEPGGSGWKDPVLEHKLRSRLPKSYDLFLDTINDINGTMNGLKEELGVSREAFQKGLEPQDEKQKKRAKSRNPLKTLINKQKSDSQQQAVARGNRERSWKKWLTRPNIEYQTQRVKFGFGRATRQKLFEEFARYNGRLRELLDTSDRSTALKQSREQTKKSIFKKAVGRFWRHASSLHELLYQALCCQCKHMHLFHLLLHHETDFEGAEYRMRFLYTSNPVLSAPWKCIGVRAEHKDNMYMVVPPVSNQQSLSSTTAKMPKPPISNLKTQETFPKSALRGPATFGPTSRPKVNWSDSSASTNATNTIQNQGAETIHDLCTSITKCGPTSMCLGLLQGDEDSFLLQRDHESQQEPYRAISLENLLKQGSSVRLDRRQRYTLAFTLASSHLKLYPSPWLHSHWSKKEIIFLGHPDDANSFKLDQPYMLRDTTSKTPHSTSSYASSDRLLLTLGILLIELCFGSALEDHEMRRQYHSTIDQTQLTADATAAFDLAVALEWSRSVGGEAGELYADAVQWCLKPQVAGACDDKWRQELFTNVVLPLGNCHEQMYPRTNAV